MDHRDIATRVDTTSSTFYLNLFTSDQPTTFNIANYADEIAIILVHENPNVASKNLQLHLDNMLK